MGNRICLFLRWEYEIWFTGSGISIDLLFLYGNGIDGLSVGSGYWEVGLE